MIFNKKKNTTAINEFNQEIAGNSLTKDAWRRLRKNKMAVISLVIVIIYILLAVLAPILPIYPYDEIILDHQHLPPSFTKNAGELLMEKRLADLYTQAWRQGNLELTEEEDDMLWEWIDSNEVNKVWDYMYEKGNAMVADGSYTLSSYEQRRIDSLKEDIRTELQITLKEVWYRADSGSERVKLTSLNTDEILAAYAQLVNISAEDQKTQYMKEIEQQVLREIKERTPDLSDEEYEILLDQEFNDMSESRLNTLIRSNVLVKLNNTIRSVGLRNLKNAAEDGTLEFPLEDEISISETISATIKASKVHERQYYLGTDYQGRDMLSRIIYGGTGLDRDRIRRDDHQCSHRYRTRSTCRVSGRKGRLLHHEDSRYHVRTSLHASGHHRHGDLRKEHPQPILRARHHQLAHCLPYGQRTDHVAEESGVHRGCTFDGSSDEKNYIQTSRAQLIECDHRLLDSENPVVHHDREFPLLFRPRCPGTLCIMGISGG